jgi:acetolactate synthase-1/2/3 large subunit
MLGMHGLKAANKAVQRADLLVALGMRFDDRVTGKPDRFAREAAVIHADIDATEFNKIVPADVTLHGDLRETLRALVDELVRADTSRASTTGRRSAAARRSAAQRSGRTTQLSATGVLDRFFAAIPADAIVTTDVGQHQMWAAQRARPAHPRKFATSAGLGAMGFGFPAAIGAAFANPGTPVYAIVGDGGFQMCLPELATLRRYDVPVKIVLIDNQNLGMVRQWQELFFSERYSATNLADNPDFAAIARAYGIDAFALTDPQHAAATIARFVASPRTGAAALRLPSDRERVADDPGRDDGRRPDGSARMTCDLTLRDVRSVARIVNLAHRFNCRCTRIARARPAT